ncbi:MAG: hypothetical protein JXM71_10235 [Spirochaetales bacterium]|nr:hypothetical protein [Spirochaetales bacterium]
MKGLIKTIVTLAVLGGALYLTNPTITDFGSYYGRKQVASQKNTGGVLGDIAKALAESGADLVVKAGFKRDDKLIFSVYTLGPASKPLERYIGFAKFVFIELPN